MKNRILTGTCVLFCALMAAGCTNISEQMQTYNETAELSSQAPAPSEANASSPQTPDALDGSETSSPQTSDTLDGSETSSPETSADGSETAVPGPGIMKNLEGVHIDKNGKISDTDGNTFEKGGN